MKTIEERRREVLLATLEWFYNNPRSIRPIEEEEGCAYSTPDGRRCAIGRLVDEKLARKLELECRGMSVNTAFYLLPPEVQELGKQFLYELQYLHDRSTFWTHPQHNARHPGPLRHKGVEHVLEMRKTYGIPMTKNEIVKFTN